MAVNKKIRQNKIIQLVIILFGIVLIINLCRDIRRLLRAGDQIKLTENQLAELEEENQELQQKKEYYSTPEFVEEQARNKLNMVRPGETMVILPPNIEEILGKNKKIVSPDLPNWQKWWQLFF